MNIKNLKISVINSRLIWKIPKIITRSHWLMVIFCIKPRKQKSILVAVADPIVDDDDEYADILTVVESIEVVQDDDAHRAVVSQEKEHIADNSFQPARDSSFHLHNHSRINLVEQYVFWVVYVLVRVDVVHNPLDLLNPYFDLLVLYHIFRGFIHASVRTPFRMRSAIPFALLFAPGTLLPICAVCETAVEYRHHIFHAFAFHQIVAAQFEFIVVHDHRHQIGVVRVYFAPSPTIPELIVAQPSVNCRLHSVYVRVKLFHSYYMSRFDTSSTDMVGHLTVMVFASIVSFSYYVVIIFQFYINYYN